MNKERRSIIKTLSRALRLRCPVCGESSIVGSPFHIKHQCPACDALFKREDGFFVGAIMANVVTTEFVILVLYVAALPVINTRFELVLTILSAVALIFPVAFYHHSWSFWLGFDHLVETLPKAPKTPN
ncbi:MAG TPA: DUF983 domain-containing protein [Pyrinomonadaceae bacterium]|nr:DUF983 domain-containing protein [Pyrinomonadaceae bacterium]